MMVMALKQGQLRKSWQERYFLLTIEYFGYFPNQIYKEFKKEKDEKHNSHGYHRSCETKHGRKIHKQQGISILSGSDM